MPPRPGGPITGPAGSRQHRPGIRRLRRFRCRHDVGGRRHVADGAFIGDFGARDAAHVAADPRNQGALVAVANDQSALLHRRAPAGPAHRVAELAHTEVHVADGAAVAALAGDAVALDRDDVVVVAADHAPAQPLAHVGRAVGSLPVDDSDRCRAGAMRRRLAGGRSAATPERSPCRRQDLPYSRADDGRRNRAEDRSAAGAAVAKLFPAIRLTLRRHRQCCHADRPIHVAAARAMGSSLFLDRIRMAGDCVNAKATVSTSVIVFFQTMTKAYRLAEPRMPISIRLASRS